MADKRIPSLADLEKLRKEAKIAEENSTAATNRLKEAEESFKDTPEIRTKLVIIKALEKERDEKAKGKPPEEHDGIIILYNETIATLKRNPEETIKASILDTIIRVARETNPK